MSLPVGAAFAVYLAGIPVVGLVPASLGFLALVRNTFLRRWIWLPLVLAVVAALQVLMLQILMGRPLSFGYLESWF